MALFLCVTAQGQTILEVGNTGANTGLDTNTFRAWNFAITTAGETSGVTASRAVLGLNKGPSTTDAVVMTFYRGFGGASNASAVVLTIVTVAAVDIGKVFNTNTVFSFTPVALTAGPYSVEFSTAAPTGGNTAYGLKQGLLTLTDMNGVPLSNLLWIQDTTSTGMASTNFAATDVLADYRLSTTNIAYGSYRVGATLSTQVSLTNSAVYTSNNATEKLSPSNVTSGQATISGFSTNLIAVTASTSFTVGLNTASVGTNTGSVMLSYKSDINGTAATRTGGPTNIGSQVISVSGVGYRLATNGLSATNMSFGNYHLNSILSGSVGLTNMSSNDGFSEKLGVSTNNISANLTVSGGPTGLLSALSSANLTVGMNSSSVGTNTGSFTLNFTSDGAGTSGLSASNIGSRVITVSGVGYRLAAATLGSTNIDLGRIHAGGAFTSQYLALTNSAAGGSFTETLGASFGAATGGATGSGSVTNIAAGSGDSSSLLVGISDSTPGVKLGTLQLDATSREVNWSGLGTTALNAQTVVVTGIVYTGQSQWNTSGNGNWSSFSNWNSAGGTPGLDGALSTNDTATFGAGPVSGTTTVSLNGVNPVLSTLVFSNNSTSYVLAPGSGGALTLGTAGYAGSISDSGGSHSISAPINLATDTLIKVENSGDTLTISGNISGNNKQLFKTGAGTLLLSGSNTYSGATVVTNGVLQLAGYSMGFGSLGLTNATMNIANGTGYYGRVTLDSNATMNIGAGGLLQAGSALISGTGSILTVKDLGMAVFGGAVTNTGTIVVQNQSTVSFNAGLANNSSLKFGAGVNPSTAIISGTLTLGSSGFVSMTYTNDTLVMRGDFVNGSTDAANFNMRNSVMTFGGSDSGVTNTFEVAGINRGTNAVGLNNNMAVGTLNITNSIQFVDNINNRGGGGTSNEVLYVDVLHLFSGATITMSRLTVYVSTMFIDENSGQTFTSGVINKSNAESLGLFNVFLDDGGQIVIIPEPSTCALVGLGMAMLSCSRRRLRRPGEI